MGEPERVTIPEAERITGLCARTLQHMSARGKIWGAAKLGRRWTYDRQRLRAWVLANESAAESRNGSTSATAFSMPVSPLKAQSIGDPLKLAIERKLKGVSTNG